MVWAAPDINSYAHVQQTRMKHVQLVYLVKNNVVGRGEAIELSHCCMLFRRNEEIARDMLI